MTINLDEIDIDILRENFDDEIITEIDPANASKILNYLVKEGIYYAKDIFISSLDLFLMTYDEFVKKFEKIKSNIGEDYIEKIGEDLSLLEPMYND